MSASPDFYSEGYTPARMDTQLRVDQKILGAILDGAGGGGGGGVASGNVHGAGSPVGSHTPDAVDQIYRDTTTPGVWISTGLLNTSWLQIACIMVLLSLSILVGHGAGLTISTVSGTGTNTMLQNAVLTNGFTAYGNDQTHKPIFGSQGDNWHVWRTPPNGASFIIGRNDEDIDKGYWGVDTAANEMSMTFNGIGWGDAPNIIGFIAPFDGLDSNSPDNTVYSIGDFNFKNPQTFKSATFNDGVTNTTLSTSSLMATDANKKQVSLAIGTGLHSDGTTLTATATGGSGTGTTNEVWFNVKDYGATGDGVTDDTASIQSAINAAITTNSPCSPTIFFPRGIYLIGASPSVTLNSQLILPKINSHLVYSNWSGVVFLGEELPQVMVGTALGSTSAYPTNGSVLKIVNKGTAGSATFASYSGDNTYGFNLLSPVFSKLRFLVDKDNTGTVLRLTNVVRCALVNVSAHPFQTADNSANCNASSVFCDLPNVNSGTEIYLENVDISHFAQGIRTGEHVTGRNLHINNCITATDDGTAIFCKQGNYPNIFSSILISGNNLGIAANGANSIIRINGLISERVTGREIYESSDVSNLSGFIEYDVADDNDGSKAHKKLVTGGGGLLWFNLFYNTYESSSTATISPFDTLGSRGPKYVYTSDSARVGGITLVKQEGTDYAPTKVLSGNPAGGAVFFAGRDSAGNINTCAAIYPIASADASSGNTPCDLQFRVGTNASSLTLAMTMKGTGDIAFGKTITTGGTTGAQTINKPSGTVNFAALATSLVVTDSLVTTSSVIICTVGTVDSTMKSVVAVAGNGSFTITSNAAATAETRVNFLVTN